MATASLVQAKGRCALNGVIMDPDSMDDQRANVLLLKSEQIAAAGGAPLHGFPEVRWLWKASSSVI
jgi:hypothetical protein